VRDPVLELSGSRDRDCLDTDRSIALGPVDDVPTLADSPSMRRLAMVSSAGTTSGRRRATGSSFTSYSADVSISTLQDTMQRQDVQRTRSFVRLAALVAFAMAAPLPFIGGDFIVKVLFAISLAATAAVCTRTYFELGDPSRYELGRVLRTGYVCIAAAYFGIGFFGVYSPAAVVIPFGLYFFGLAHSFRGTLFVYVICAVTYAIMTGLVAFGVIRDRGLVQPIELSLLESLVVITAVQVLFFATYLIARASRRATESAIAQHDQVVRAIAGRDALLQEARMDLEGVLRARGLGRFTDEAVGDYHLGEILGRGGMGEVYDAVHVDSEEPAAVKLLHPHVLDDPNAVKRFLRECRIASQLRVPNVVRVVATSEPGAPIPFIAMERLHGVDLADHLRAHGRMRPREVIRLIREVGAGLVAASEAGIVHRDIKPRNLFLADADSDARPVWKVLDFGVSKLAGEATVTHQNVVGTPSYMAPEQARGQEVCHKTDLYALGVIAYRCLTGRPAFSGDSAPAILYQVVNEMPPCPSEVSGRLAPEVDLILAIAMAKDVRDRFDVVAELADGLEKAARGRISSALRTRAERLIAQHPWR